MQIVKSSFLRTAVFMHFFVVLQPSQGSFKQNFMTKPIKLSLQSSQFLKNNIICQQNFLMQRAVRSQEPAPPYMQSVQSMLQLQKLIYKNGEITTEHMQNLFEVLGKAKKILVEKNMVFDCLVQDQAWNLWWNFLQQSLNVAQLRGYEKDLMWLRAQIAEFKIVSAVGMCIDLMHHFNGLLVTDYDFLVLDSLVVALVAMEC